MVHQVHFKLRLIVQTSCPLMRLPAELRNVIYGLLFALPTEQIELIDAGKRHGQIFGTCQVLYTESKQLYDATGAAHAAYWTRDFNLTKPFRQNELMQRVPDWCFAHITGLHIHSRAFTCDLRRQGNIWLGHSEWTRWNERRWGIPYSSSHCLLTATADDDPQYWLTDLSEATYKDLRDWNIIPTLAYNDVVSAASAKRLRDVLLWECCDDLLLPAVPPSEAESTRQPVKKKRVKLVIAAG